MAAPMLPTKSHNFDSYGIQSRSNSTDVVGGEERRRGVSTYRTVSTTGETSFRTTPYEFESTVAGDEHLTLVYGEIVTVRTIIEGPPLAGLIQGDPAPRELPSAMGKAEPIAPA